MNITLTTVECTASTNADVRRALEEGRAEGYSLLAREQTGGYGRRGNTWVSAPGGLYLSVLLRPQRELEEWPTLSLLAALSVLRAVGEVAPAALPVLRVKAPNDVIVGDEVEHPLKLSGILPETHAGGVALGFGVNLNRADAAAPADVAAADSAVQHVGGKNTPVYLAELAGLAQPIDPRAFARVLLAHFDECYEQWQQHGFAPFEPEYAAVFATPNTPNTPNA